MVASLCNNASFLTSTSSGVIDLDHDMLKPDFNLLALDCSGDASEQGLTKFVEPIRATRDYRDQNPKVFEIKFNSTNKWQVSIHKQVSQAYKSQRTGCTRDADRFWYSKPPNNFQRHSRASE